MTRHPPSVVQLLFFPLLCGLGTAILPYVSGCSGDRPEIKTSPPIASYDPERVLETFPSVPVVSDLSRKPTHQSIAIKDISNGMDDDHDGLVDEDGCFCRRDSILGDANGDGAITELDQACQILLMYRKTVVQGGTQCMDVNHDGLVSMDDVIQNRAGG